MTSSGDTGSATIQASLWGQRARDWAELEERHSSLFDAIFDEVALSTGMRLLDVGCGAGVACQIALERGAHVVGLDATPELLAIARARAPQAAFHHGDMEQLPFEADSFDVVTGFNSFPYAAHPEVALREAKRVARPGGRVAAVVLSPPERSRWMMAQRQAVGALVPPPRPDGPGPTALSDFQALAALAHDAGLTPLSHATFPCAHVFADEEEALRLCLSTGPNIRASQIVGEAAVRAALTGAMPPFRHADGTYRFDREYMYLIASA